jgi:hypothetical protein
MRDKIDKIIYCHIDDQHPDSLRFLRDAEKLIGKPIEILQSPYQSVDAVMQQFRFVNSAHGAKCTEILKRRVRKEWEVKQTEPLKYVWGMDNGERKRIEPLKRANPNQEHLFPLVDEGLLKQDCHAISARLGMKRPAMYDLGFHNNNCIGCVKQGMYFWNLTRKYFPNIFALRAKREREIGHSCVKECFLDELDPRRGREEDEISKECGIMCFINLP